MAYCFCKLYVRRRRKFQNKRTHHYKAFYDAKSESVTMIGRDLHDHDDDVDRYDVTIGKKSRLVVDNENHRGSLKSPILYKDVDG